jgi:hypothetical protein
LFIVGNLPESGLFSGTFIAWLIGFAIIANGLVLVFAGRDGHWTW